MQRLRQVAFVATLLASCAAFAQCPEYSTSYYDTYRIIGAPAIGQAQRGSAWEFHRIDANGPLLTGGVLNGVSAHCWITPGAPFFIPCVGPVCSTNAAQDQLPVGRSRTIDGIFTHPGNDSSTDNVIVFRPQGPATINTLSVVAEDLSTNLSDGAMIDVKVLRADGTTSVLVPPSLVPRDTTNHTFTPTASALPVVLAVGDRIVTTVNMNGNPNEDWINLDIRLTARGAPIILKSPRDASICSGLSTDFFVQTLVASSYRWRKNGTPLFDSAHVTGTSSPTLTIMNSTGADAGAYDCVVTNSCGSVTSAAASLRVCIADVDDGSGSGQCDGGVTIDDLLYYLGIFEEGTLRADVDDGTATGTPDGGVTIDDLLYFLSRFEAGC